MKNNVLRFWWREQLAATNFNALLLDVMLPDGDGFQMCREVRSLGIAFPIRVRFSMACMALAPLGLLF